MVSLFIQPGLSIVEGDCALLSFLDLLLLYFEDFDKICIDSFWDRNSSSENVKLVSLLQFTRRNSQSCHCNCILLSFLYAVNLWNFSKPSFDSLDAVSLSLEWNIFNFFQKSVDELMSFWCDSSLNNGLFCLWCYSDSEGDELGIW